MHTLKIFMIEPEVVLEKIVVNPGNNIQAILVRHLFNTMGTALSNPPIKMSYDDVTFYCRLLVVINVDIQERTKTFVS